jgi:hypothetical protein
VKGHHLGAMSVKVPQAGSSEEHTGYEAAFRVACLDGHLDVVRELLSLEGERAVNVHSGVEAS